MNKDLKEAKRKTQNSGGGHRKPRGRHMQGTWGGRTGRNSRKACGASSRREGAGDLSQQKRARAWGVTSVTERLQRRGKCDSQWQAKALEHFEKTGVRICQHRNHSGCCAENRPKASKEARGLVRTLLQSIRHKVTVVWARVATMERNGKGQILDIPYLKSRSLRDSGAGDGLSSLTWQLGAWSSHSRSWERRRGATLEAQFGALKFAITIRCPSGNVKETRSTELKGSNRWK